MKKGQAAAAILFAIVMFLTFIAWGLSHLGDTRAIFQREISISHQEVSTIGYGLLQYRCVSDTTLGETLPRLLLQGKTSASEIISSGITVESCINAYFESINKSFSVKLIMPNSQVPAFVVGTLEKGIQEELPLLLHDQSVGKLRTIVEAV